MISISLILLIFVGLSFSEITENIFLSNQFTYYHKMLEGTKVYEIKFFAYSSKYYSVYLLNSEDYSNWGETQKPSIPFEISLEASESSSSDGISVLKINNTKDDFSLDHTNDANFHLLVFRGQNSIDANDEVFLDVYYYTTYDVFGYYLIPVIVAGVVLAVLAVVVVVLGILIFRWYKKRERIALGLEGEGVEKKGKNKKKKKKKKKLRQVRASRPISANSANIRPRSNSLDRRRSKRHSNRSNHSNRSHGRRDDIREDSRDFDDNFDDLDLELQEIEDDGRRKMGGQQDRVIDIQELQRRANEEEEERRYEEERRERERRQREEEEEQLRLIKEQSRREYEERERQRLEKERREKESQKDNRPLPPGWSKVYVESENRYFYMNENTNSVTYKFPTEEPKQDIRDLSNELDVNVELDMELSDVSEDSIPEEIDDSMVSAPPQENLPEKKGENRTLPPGWTKLWIENEGRFFYIQEDKNLVQYEFPTE